MDRRSNNQRGFVNFPVNDPRYVNSNEGGMFVRLVVRPRETDDPFMLCCGGYQSITYDENYIAPNPYRDQAMAMWEKADSEEDTAEAMKMVEAARLLDKQAETDRFPQLNVERQYADVNSMLEAVTSLEKYQSEDYLAILTIGSTGWSGWDEAAGHYWECTEDNLTEGGKELIMVLRALYKGCEIELQTWLDT